MPDPVKYILDESRIPKHWYNLQEDLPKPLPPVLHPGTQQPLGPDDLALLFPMALIEQEVTLEREVPISEPVREVYRQWRPCFALHRRCIFRAAAWRASMNRNRFTRSFAAFAWMILGWTIAATASAGTLQGTATYRERMMLPPDAVFEAQLQDIARAGAPAVVLGRARLDPAGQPPFRFEIPYDDAAIKPGGRYSVRATITHAGKLLFTTDRIYPVLDGRNAPLELLLVSAHRKPPAGAPAASLGKLPASFEGEVSGAGRATRWHVDLYPEGRYQVRQTDVGRPEPNQFDDIGRWTQERESGRLVLRGGRDAPLFFMPVDGGAALRKLDLTGKPVESGGNDRLQRLPQHSPIEPRLLMNGMFVYLADAANIVLCVDNRSVPVSMERDYKALEAAYMQARPAPGARVLVTVEGQLAPRPSMESSQPPRVSLVVERFVSIWPGKRCGDKR